MYPDKVFILISIVLRLPYLGASGSVPLNWFSVTLLPPNHSHSNLANREQLTMSLLTTD